MQLDERPTELIGECRTYIIQTNYSIRIALDLECAYHWFDHTKDERNIVVFYVHSDESFSTSKIMQNTHAYVMLSYSLKWFMNEIVELTMALMLTQHNKVVSSHTCHLLNQFQYWHDNLIISHSDLWRICSTMFDILLHKFNSIYTAPCPLCVCVSKITRMHIACNKQQYLIICSNEQLIVLILFWLIFFLNWNNGITQLPDPEFLWK